VGREVRLLSLMQHAAAFSRKRQGMTKTNVCSMKCACGEKCGCGSLHIWRGQHRGGKSQVMCTMAAPLALSCHALTLLYLNLDMYTMQSTQCSSLTRPGTSSGSLRLPTRTCNQTGAGSQHESRGS
jgi:hypothetical protein